MNKLIALFALIALFSLSACGMKRALTLPEDSIENKAQADEKDLMEF